MELDTLLRYLLPHEIFEYFDLKEIREIENNQLQLYLDEKKVPPSEFSSKEIVSNGFDEAVRIQDFPLRDKAVFFVVRRRKWKEKGTSKIYKRSWDLTANGTSYSKEFADFLKGLFG